MEAGKKRIRYYETDGTSARKRSVVSDTESEVEYQYEQSNRYEYEYEAEPVRTPRRKSPKRTLLQKWAEAREQAYRKEQRELRQGHRTVSVADAPAIDFVSMLVLTCAIALTFYVCVGYLQVQSYISVMNKKTAKLMTQADALAIQNDYEELMIRESVDLEEIGRIATEELGMVYPYHNRVIDYKVTKQGYVRQYGDLLGNEQKPPIELLLRMLVTSGMR